MRPAYRSYQDFHQYVDQCGNLKCNYATQGRYSLKPGDGCIRLIAGRVKQKVSGEDENPSGYFDDTVRQWKIYYKELVTIVYMMQTLDAEGVTDIDIVLVGDSKAVIGSLKKMMGPERSWTMLDIVWDLVNRWGLLFIWIESAGNVAHSATHNEAIDEK